MSCRRLSAALAVLLSCCMSPRLLPLHPPQAAASAEHGERPLHVLTSVDEAADPLPLMGSAVSFADVASSLGGVIEQAATDWSRFHAAQRVGGWELKVELVHSRAELSGRNMTVELATRVTLNARLGQVYLAQTHGYCKQTARFDEAAPATLVYACMDAMAHDLAGWLEGVQP